MLRDPNVTNCVTHARTHMVQIIISRSRAGREIKIAKLKISYFLGQCIKNETDNTHGLNSIFLHSDLCEINLEIS